MKTKSLKLPASAVSPQDPVAQPLGPATISGTTITVDLLVQNPTIIPPIIRNLVAGNRGYFADKIFQTPGTPVTGGIVIGTPTFPEDFFLPSDQSLAPRAPGAEAPRIGATRRKPEAFYPESWSGSIEITDEAKRRNDVYSITRQLTQAANTLANIMQKRAIEVLKSQVSTWSREHANKTNWHEAAAEGIYKVDPAKMPAADFAYVEELFTLDEAGRQPAYLIVNPTDAFYLQIKYAQFGGLQAILDDYNLTLLKTPRVTEGEAFYVCEGGIGPMLFETPLTQETERIAGRKTTVTVLEATPAFAPLDASAVIRLTGLGS